jgi:hypothetical protein
MAAQVVLPTTSDSGALHLFDITPQSATRAGQANQQFVPGPMTPSTPTPTDGPSGLSAR